MWGRRLSRNTSTQSSGNVPATKDFFIYYDSAGQAVVVDNLEAVPIKARSSAKTVTLPKSKKADGLLGVGKGLGKKLKNPCADEKELFRRADKILYLAKDSGGNRSVAMFDILEIPLTAKEYSDFVQYLENIPATERTEAAKRFVDLRLANSRAPLFWNYPYQKYLQDS